MSARMGFLASARVGLASPGQPVGSRLHRAGPNSPTGYGVTHPVARVATRRRLVCTVGASALPVPLDGRRDGAADDEPPASFAEFERSIIAERTRDKIAASRRKGKWTGGPVPFGCSAKEKKLVVNDVEARVVCEAFALFLQHRQMAKVARKLNERGH